MSIIRYQNFFIIYQDNVLDCLKIDLTFLIRELASAIVFVPYVSGIGCLNLKKCKIKSVLSLFIFRNQTNIISPAF